MNIIETTTYNIDNELYTFVLVSNEGARARTGSTILNIGRVGSPEPWAYWHLGSAPSRRYVIEGIANMLTWIYNSDFEEGDAQRCSDLYNGANEEVLRYSE